MNENIISIKLENEIRDKIISDYLSDIRKDLLNGEVVNLEGIGKLVPKFRNVKNDLGRNYTITVKLNKNKDFDEELINAYNNDNNKFLNINKKRGK